jgi:hypothetical protein
MARTLVVLWVVLARAVALATVDLRAGRRRRLVWSALIIGSIASAGGAVFWAIALVESI